MIHKASHRIRCNGLALNTARTQRGAIIPLVAVAMVVLLGAAGLSLDIGYLVAARHDLENAADSAALAGARQLTMGTVPNFTQAKTVAESMVSESGNTVVGKDLSSATVTTGGWDLSGVKKGLQPYVAGGSYAPAVEVRIQMTGANGVVPALFSRVFGFNTFDSRFTAVAVGDISPGVIDPNQLLPLAMSQCMFDKFWNPLTQGPRLVPQNYDSAYPPCPFCDLQTPGSPYLFKILSDNTKIPPGSPSCSAAGQWTSFDDPKNDANYISSLINNGNPTSLCISGCSNTQIWVNAGTQATIYQEIGTKLGVGKKGGDAPGFGAFVPVVTGDVRTHQMQSISGFACVKVTKVDATSQDKWVQMQMLPVSTTPIMGLTNSPFVCQIKGSGAVAGGYLARPPGLVNYWGNNWE